MFPTDSWFGCHRTILQLLVATTLIINPALGIHLPNTSSIDGQLTANLGVDQFFSLWIVFNNDDVVISDEPFTILAPRNTAIIKDNAVLQQPELVKRLLTDHIVLGSQIRISNDFNSTRYETLGGKSFTLSPEKEGRLKANEANVVETKLVLPNGQLIVLDNYLFPDDVMPVVVVEKNKSDNVVGGGSGGGGGTFIHHMISVKEGPQKSPPARNSTFVENVMQVLSLLKSGVRVFQHFLTRSNVSKLLLDDEEYTVFVPTDHAFQRWHPIDWGFYPFSVPEFTETVIINHFVKGKLKQDNIGSEQVAKTLGGKEVVFRKAPNLTINGASIVKGDTPLPKGNMMFISEVLFVSESVVSRLHQQHRDKETPPLLAFPWFGAQFLSHAFLALERDKRFTHITRFLNLADLAPHVSGTGYTFFVPTDTAFEEIGLDKMPDNYLSTGDGLEILLNHFVKGRLYDRDLKDNLTLITLGNETIKVERQEGGVFINKAHIVESEVFVYNLGTMFYIDKVLFSKKLIPHQPTKKVSPGFALPTIMPSTSKTDNPISSYNNSTKPTTTTMPATTETAIVTTVDVETVPEELSETIGSLPDVLFADAEINSNSSSNKEATETYAMTETESTSSDSISTTIDDDGNNNREYGIPIPDDHSNATTIKNNVTLRDK